MEERRKIITYIENKYGVRIGTTGGGVGYPSWVRKFVRGESERYGFGSCETSGVTESTRNEDKDSRGEYEDGDEYEYYRGWRNVIGRLRLARLFLPERRVGETQRDYIDKARSRFGRLLVYVKTVENDIKCLDRLRKWASENRSPLAFAVMSVTIAVIMVGMLSRKMTARGSGVVYGAAAATHEASKKLPPVISDVMKEITKLLDTTGDLMLLLACNLWVICIMAAVGIVFS
ncbi:Hypothetical predicted protein [Paramuricea clavata]|uniref:Uncharacterized protein n=1 Tax=Paramuricea clavata TaxID=317549 RepID=A0A6S7IYW6_PARCT|nr:Hypothetical predicted protein [Paramuricea clavata]